MIPEKMLEVLKDEGVVSIFEDTDLGIITAVCYVGAIISGSKN